MLRLLVDQDLDHDILRGLIRRIPRLDAVTASEIGMGKATDPQLLTRAAREGGSSSRTTAEPCPRTRPP